MTRAIIIQRSPSERRPGPRKPRTAAQKAATRNWISRCPWQFQQWLDGLTPLPKGWSARGGKLTPPKRQAPPERTFGPFLPQPYGPFPFEVLRRATMPRAEMRKMRDYIEVELLRRSWDGPALDEKHADWQAIRAWINHLPNMLRATGRPAYFRVEKSAGRLAIWFTDAAVALRFFEAFAPTGVVSSPALHS